MSEDESKYDVEQLRLMSELCILVDERDNVVGSCPKGVCHRKENIDNNMVHRAFSVFLFTQENRLLLQRRSHKKIIFPNLLSNACCSHPLYNELELSGEIGVKNAVKRKLFQELGIYENTYDVNDLNLVARVRHVATSDEYWGENEMDYILILKNDVELHPNMNEVSETRLVEKSQLKLMIQEDDSQFTPWFRKIFHSGLLLRWWEEVENNMVKCCNDIVYL